MFYKMAQISNNVHYFEMEVPDEKLDQIRIENEKYLRKHPEVQKMISDFLISLLHDKNDNVLQYAVAFFTTYAGEPE